MGGSSRPPRRRGRGAERFCYGSRSHRVKKGVLQVKQLFSLTHIYFFGRTTCATTFAQTTYTRAVSSMAARARSGWAEAPLSGGIGPISLAPRPLSRRYKGLPRPVRCRRIPVRVPRFCVPSGRSQRHQAKFYCITRCVALKRTRATFPCGSPAS